jgi:hypothetical protein
MYNSSNYNLINYNGISGNDIIKPIQVSDLSSFIIVVDHITSFIKMPFAKSSIMIDFPIFNIKISSSN